MNAKEKNYKVQIMEALSQAPTNLVTNKAFMWAASNLPDEGGVGEYSTKVRTLDFNQEDTMRALGFDENIAENMNKKLSDCLYDVLFVQNNVKIKEYSENSFRFDDSTIQGNLTKTSYILSQLFQVLDKEEIEFLVHIALDKKLKAITSEAFSRKVEEEREKLGVQKPKINMVDSLQDLEDLLKKLSNLFKDPRNDKPEN